MKIGHLTFGTPEYVRVTKMAERRAEAFDNLRNIYDSIDEIEALSGTELLWMLQGKIESIL